MDIPDMLSACWGYFLFVFVLWVRIGAGLPNIKGNYYAHAFSVWMSSENGLFTAYNSYNRYPPVNQAGTGYSTATFDAAKANEVYGNSDTVTPLSIACRIYMKY